MKIFSWLVRREFWENRAIWIIPPVIGAALTLATLFGRVDVNGVILSMNRRTAVSALMLFGFGMIFFLVMNVYATWYLLDCLYAERKDRSILFWKSLPVSDTATVLAKLFTALIAIPLVYFVAADLSTLLMAFVVSVRGRNAIAASLWSADLWLQLQALWLYLILTTAIWYLPIAGWLIAVSAWARRAVMLWSVLTPLGLCLLERWFFGTHLLGSLLLDRTFDYTSHAFRDLPGGGVWVTLATDGDWLAAPGGIWRVFDPIGFLASPATWIGSVVGALFVVAAIQLRIRRTE